MSSTAQTNSVSYVSSGEPVLVTQGHRGLAIRGGHPLVGLRIDEGEHHPLLAGPDPGRDEATVAIGVGSELPQANSTRPKPTRSATVSSDQHVEHDRSKQRRQIDRGGGEESHRLFRVSEDSPGVPKEPGTEPDGGDQVDQPMPATGTRSRVIPTMRAV